MLLIYTLYLVPFVLLTIFLLYRNHWPQPWTLSMPNFDETFLRYVATDGFWGGNQEIRLLLSKLLSCYRNPGCEGVLVFLEPTKFQMIQFPNNLLKSSSPVRFKGLPMIPISKWGHATKKSVALDFLGCTNSEKVEIIPCSAEDVFRALFEHMAATCRSSGEVDQRTGCKIYRGHLSPKKV